MTLFGLTVTRIHARQVAGRALSDAWKFLLFILTILIDNVSFFLLVAGIVVLYVGVADYSKAAANVVLGTLLIALSVFPYLAARKN